MLSACRKSTQLLARGCIYHTLGSSQLRGRQTVSSVAPTLTRVEARVSEVAATQVGHRAAAKHRMAGTPIDWPLFSVAQQPACPAVPKMLAESAQAINAGNLGGGGLRQLQAPLRVWRLEVPHAGAPLLDGFVPVCHSACMETYPTHTRGGVSVTVRRPESKSLLLRLIQPRQQRLLYEMVLPRGTWGAPGPGLCWGDSESDKLQADTALHRYDFRALDMYLREFLVLGSIPPSAVRAYTTVNYSGALGQWRLCSCPLMDALGPPVRDVSAEMPGERWVPSISKGHVVP